MLIAVCIETKCVKHTGVLISP